MNVFAGFGRRHVLIALCFSFVVELAHLSSAWLGVPAPSASPGIIAIWTVMYLLMALLGLGCAVAADNLLGASASTAKRLVAALLATAIVTTVTAEALLDLFPALQGKEQMVFLGPLHRIAYRFSLASGWALLLIGLYTMLQASRRATERLHDTQLAALAAERNLVEADLRAMQARVEPDLLFAALLAVDHAYSRSVPAGEEALDALIGFLRAALPAEASATSTVAAEVDLVRAYLGVVKLVSGPELALDIDVEPSARTRAMPAMLLLPLVRWAVEGAPSASLTMGARVHEQRLEVTLHSDLPEPAPSAEIHGLQARLAQLFAGRARLEASLGPAGRGARLEIPLSA